MSAYLGRFAAARGGCRSRTTVGRSTSTSMRDPARSGATTSTCTAASGGSSRPAVSPSTELQAAWSWSCDLHHGEGANAMNTVELVRFRVAQDRTDALLEARSAMLEHLRADREGFLGARLVSLSGNEWLDIVDWRSPEDFAASARRRISRLRERRARTM